MDYSILVAGHYGFTMNEIGVAPARVLEPEPLGKFGDLGIPNPPLGKTAKLASVPRNEGPAREVSSTTACQRSHLDRHLNLAPPVQSWGRFLAKKDPGPPAGA